MTNFENAFFSIFLKFGRNFWPRRNFWQKFLHHMKVQSQLYNICRIWENPSINHWDIVIWIFKDSGLKKTKMAKIHYVTGTCRNFCRPPKFREWEIRCFSSSGKPLSRESHVLGPVRIFEKKIDQFLDLFFFDLQKFLHPWVLWGSRQKFLTHFSRVLYLVLIGAKYHRNP